MEIYYNSSPSKNLSSNGIEQNVGNNENNLETLTSLTQITSQAMNVTSDPALLEALRLVEQRVTEIQEGNL